MVDSILKNSVLPISENIAQQKVVMKEFGWMRNEYSSGKLIAVARVEAKRYSESGPGSKSFAVLSGVY
jgi:hypothetical protein